MLWLIEDMLELVIYGGIIRDQRGDWKGGFSDFVGNCSAVLAEFWGALKGLKLSKLLNIQRVKLNVDSVIVAKTIEDGEIGIIDRVVVLRQIIYIIGEHEIVIVSHAFRFTNGCADMLATRGCIKKKKKNSKLYKRCKFFF